MSYTCAATKNAHAAAHEDGSETGHRLCAEHYSTLRKTLVEIEDEAAVLSVAPSIAMHWNTSGGSSKGATLASQQAPVRLDAVALNDHRVREGLSEEDDDRHASGGITSVLGTLHYWAARTREERRMVNPTERLTIHRERDTLTRQLPWIVEQEWVGEFYRKMRKLLDQLQRANGTKPPKPFGRCPAQPQPGVECGGPLWYTTPVATVGEWNGSTPSAIQCAECSARWEGGTQLALLFMSLEKAKAAKKAAASAEQDS